MINLNQIKTELCNKICGESVSEISVDSFSLHLHGKDKNMLKIECVNTYTRNFLIKKARNRIPRGIYVIEFLPSDKVPMYRNLHKLRLGSHIHDVHRRGLRSFFPPDSSACPFCMETCSVQEGHGVTQSYMLARHRMTSYERHTMSCDTRIIIIRWSYDVGNSTISQHRTIIVKLWYEYRTTSYDACTRSYDVMPTSTIVSHHALLPRNNVSVQEGHANELGGGKTIAALYDGHRECVIPA